MKKAAVGIGIAVLLTAAAWYAASRPATLPSPGSDDAGNGTAAGTFDPKNATYLIEGRRVTLAGGVVEEEAAPGSASKIVTRYFGNEAEGDLDGDGLSDRAFLLTQETGGSGTFFYAVAALQRPEGYRMTNAFFVGDRIAPQNTRITSRELHVNFAERKPGEPMSTPPSQGVTLLLKVTPKGVLEGLMK